MKKLVRQISSQMGVSFLEVMVSLIIMGIVTASIFKLYIAQHYNYVTQDDLTVVQQNARASIDELARHVRMAGFDLPLGLPAITGSNTNPDTITITYSTSNCDTYLDTNMTSASAELICATDVSCFDDSQLVYIFEPDSGGGEWFRIGGVVSATKHLQQLSGSSLSKAYTKDAIILPMTRISFFVDSVTNPDNPAMVMQVPGQAPQLYAENITDLQFQYRMKGGMIVDVPLVADNIREVTISITGRTANPDYEKEARGVHDPYTYRSFSTSVYLRNVGI